MTKSRLRSKSLSPKKSRKTLSPRSKSLSPSKKSSSKTKSFNQFLNRDSVLKFTASFVRPFKTSKKQDKFPFKKVIAVLAFLLLIATLISLVFMLLAYTDYNKSKSDSLKFKRYKKNLLIFKFISIPACLSFMVFVSMCFRK